MASFDFVNWGTTKIVGKWVLSTGESGVYRGQCTQVVSQLLKDLGWPSYAAARGNGNQVGANMVLRGEAVYVGTNLSSIPTNEIHIICKDVGGSGDGHVSVAAIGDIVYEQNVRNDNPTHDYGIGNTYSGRLGRLGEAWRGTRYHYKLTIDTDFDNIDGDGGGGGDPGDNPIGPNQNRYLRTKQVDVKKKKTAENNSIKNHKDFYLVQKTKRGIAQGL